MKNKITKIISTFLSVVLIVLSCFLLVKNIFFFEVMVVGTSMNATLVDGEMGYAIKVNNLTKIEQKDIIIFYHEDKEVIKRVIGKPLDKIKITDEGIYVNDIFYEEDYLDEEAKKYTYAYFSLYNELTLKEDEYFVLGDNRSVSYDSRYYGPIKREKISGKLALINGITDDTSELDNIDKEMIPWRFF
jgi:signal peptidase I